MVKEHFEVVFCIFGCPTIQKYREEIFKISNTWGKTSKTLNYKVLFFFGEERTSFIGDDYIYITGVKNNYMSASYKQNLGLKYIADNFTFDFVYVCGTDTFVNVKFLKQYLTGFNSKDKLCIGGHGCYRVVQNENVYYHSGGPGFIISYSSIIDIEHLLSNMVSSWNSIVITPNLLSACDLALCYFLSLTDCRFVIEDQYFFHCNHRGHPCHLDNEMSKDVIAYHNMSLTDFDEYEKFINETN